MRLRKALGDMFPTPTVLAPAFFQLWKHRAWNIGPGVCDIHRRRKTWVLVYLVYTWHEPGLECRIARINNEHTNIPGIMVREYTYELHESSIRVPVGTP